MKMYNANRKENSINVRFSKEETEAIVMQKYKTVNTHPTTKKRK